MNSVHGLGAAASSGATDKGGGEQQGETGRGLWQGGGDAADGVRHWKAARWGRGSSSGTALHARSVFVVDRARCASCVGMLGACVLGQCEESEGREA